MKEKPTLSYEDRPDTPKEARIREVITKSIDENMKLLPLEEQTPENRQKAIDSIMIVIKAKGTRH